MALIFCSFTWQWSFKKKCFFEIDLYVQLHISTRKNCTKVKFLSLIQNQIKHHLIAMNKKNWWKKKNTHASKCVEFVRFSLFTSQVNAENQNSNFQRFLSSSCSIGPLPNSHYISSDSNFPLSDQSQTPKSKGQKTKIWILSQNPKWPMFVLMFPGIFLRVGSCQYGINIFAEIDLVEECKKVSSTNLYVSEFQAT